MIRSWVCVKMRFGWQSSSTACNPNTIQREVCKPSLVNSPREQFQLALSAGALPEVFAL